MRNGKTLVILGLVTLAVVLAAIFTRQESTAIPRQGERLFPQLMANINDTTEVVGVSKNETFTLTRRDGHWVVKEKSDYPADANKVRQLIVGTAQFRRVEPKTRNPELYEKLCVEGINKEAAKSVKISLKNTSGAALAEFLLGERRWSRGDPSLSEYYVRLPDDPQAWLVEGKIPDDKSPTNWLDDEILELDSARVREVRVTHPDGDKVTVRHSKPSANDYQLLGLPEGAEVEFNYAVNSIGNTLTSLTLDNVKPASEVRFKNGTGLSVELETFDGLRVQMQTMKDGEDNLAWFSAMFDSSLIHEDERANKETTESADKDAKKKSRLKAPDDVKKEAETLNARWKDWVYVVPQYRIDSLGKKKSELIKFTKKTKSGKKTGG
jgi:hypothetical protein